MVKAAAHEGIPAQVRWFVFTEADTWWSPFALLAMLARFDDGLMRGLYPHGVVVGGGNRTAAKLLGPWTVMDRQALYYMADKDRISWCKEGVVEHRRSGAPCCDGVKRWNGTKARYNNDHLTSYCLFPELNADPSHIMAAECTARTSRW